ncbi:MAG: hypothetical protein AB1846_12265 [Chloroflexota bacterium]
MAILAFVILLIQWLAWIFKWGRFKSAPAGSAPGYSTKDIMFTYLATLASDFKFVLASLIFGIFSVVLLIALFTQSDFANALQAVMSTLGGLVGTIVGYFFGEKAAQAESARGVAAVPRAAVMIPGPAQPPLENGVGEAAKAMEEIEPVAPPPDLLGEDEK